MIEFISSKESYSIQILPSTFCYVKTWLNKHVDLGYNCGKVKVSSHAEGRFVVQKLTEAVHNKDMNVTIDSREAGNERV